MTRTALARVARQASVALVIAPAAAFALAAERGVAQPAIGARVVAALQVGGYLFRDLNKNGRLDPYEDWRVPVAARVEDLVSQMTVEEKAGLMVGPSLAMGPGGAVREDPVFAVNPFTGGPPSLVSPGTTDALHKRHIVQFINRENTDSRTMATWLNAVQQVAEARRLGTPVLFVTNPATTTGRGHVRDRRGLERLLAVAGDARPRGDPGCRPRGGVRADRRAGVRRRGDPCAYHRRPTSRPSPGGAASGRPSARTRASLRI